MQAIEKQHFELHPPLVFNVIKGHHGWLILPHNFLYNCL